MATTHFSIFRLQICASWILEEQPNNKRTSQFLFVEIVFITNKHRSEEENKGESGTEGTKEGGGGREGGGSQK